jgi:hypothetical protein
MKCLTRQGAFWGKADVQSLQALVLLGYAMGHVQEEVWILLGRSLPILKFRKIPSFATASDPCRTLIEVDSRMAKLCPPNSVHGV